ncbi:MAG: hypothetical protein ACJ735_15905 [Actinomycetes bacterium]
MRARCRRSLGDPGHARARRFYDRAGWSVDGAERTAEVLDVTVPEVRYRKSLAVRTD